MKLEIRENGDIYRGDEIIISREFGYDRVDAALIAEMVAAYNAREAKL